MASGGMHLIKDLPGLLIILLPVKYVLVSLTLLCSCSARCISRLVLRLPRLPLLHFLSLFASFLSFVFRGDTTHAVPYLFLYGTSQASRILFPTPQRTSRTMWTGVAIVTALTIVRSKYYKLLYLT